MGTLDRLSRVYRPSRAVHLALFRCRGECYSLGRVVFHWRLRLTRKPSINDSYLHSASKTVTQHQTTAKLYGVFASHWRSVAYSPQSSFTGSRFGTARKSLSHSCGPTINRQGITLLYDGQSYRRRLPELHLVETRLNIPALGRPQRLYKSFLISSLLCFW